MPKLDRLGRWRYGAADYRVPGWARTSGGRIWHFMPTPFLATARCGRVLANGSGRHVHPPAGVRICNRCIDFLAGRLPRSPAP
jgi:hypothetical protein